MTKRTRKKVKQYVALVDPKHGRDAAKLLKRFIV